MSDYVMNIEALRPNKLYGDMASPSNYKKYKATTERSKSKQKLIITSFSKRNNTDKNTLKSQQRYFKAVKTEEEKAQSSNNKKSNCQSEYYIKTAESKNQLGVLQLQDEIRVKQSQLQILAKRLAQAEYQLKELRQQNKLKKERIENLQKEANFMLARSLKHLQIDQIGADMVYECERYKQDHMRLLKMLQSTAEYNYFSKFAELDNGIQFLRHPNQTKKSQLDANNATKKHVHFCSCNKEFIPESAFWVPEKIYKFGKEFIKQRKGQFTVSQYELLLYEINREWRQREKIIINNFNGQKARQIQKLKRKYELYKSPEKNLLIK